MSLASLMSLKSSLTSQLSPLFGIIAVMKPIATKKSAKGLNKKPDDSGVEVVEPVQGELYATVRAIIAKARASVYVAANAAMVEAYWNVGREIVERQGGKSKAKYGDGLIKALSVRLTAEFGAGFTASNLFNMRQFYLTFPKFYTVCRELSWSHYRVLMRVENPDARRYYLVFYNYIARCFFLIDLKVGKVTPQDIGQMQLYKHYYEREMMNPGDNPPVGIVLGSDTDSAIVKYTLNEHERNLFAVKYHLALPTVEELQLELRRERQAIEEALALNDGENCREKKLK